jgi:molybdenum cofactor cytidylyltransferase
VSVVTVVLAAGRGERLGGPKALLLWPGERPLALEHVLARSECERVLVVVREAVARVLRLPPPGELVVSHEEDDLGPAGSLAAAAACVAEDAVVLVTPVDCPPVSTAVTRRLLEALGVAARPVYRGRRGHPVAIAGSVLARYRREAVPLREVLASLGDAVIDVEVDDPGVLADLDSPGDLRGPPRFLLPAPGEA